MRIENTVEVDAWTGLRPWSTTSPGSRRACRGPPSPACSTTRPTRAPSRSSSGRCACPTRARSRSRTSTRPTTAPAWPPAARTPRARAPARASVETRLEPAGDTHTRLLVTSDVQLTGKVASFGRGGAINDVATRLFGQFADCLRATLEAEFGRLRSDRPRRLHADRVRSDRPRRLHADRARNDRPRRLHPGRGRGAVGTSRRGQRDDHRRRRRHGSTRDDDRRRLARDPAAPGGRGPGRREPGRHRDQRPPAGDLPGHRRLLPPPVRPRRSQA